MLTIKDIDLFENTLKKLKLLRLEIIKQQNMINNIFDNDDYKHYLRQEMIHNLYLAHIYIKLLSTYKIIEENVNKPIIINLMTISQFIQEASTLIIDENCC